MEKSLYSKVFMWMGIGLLITFSTGYLVSNSENMLSSVFSPMSMILLIVLEFAAVIILLARISKISATTARIAFMLYSFLTGLTFSFVFVLYELKSIVIIFLLASIIFFIMAILGMFTNIDFKKFGSYLFFSLIGIIILIIVNIFLQMESIDLFICIISLFVFIMYIAYDIKVIDTLSLSVPEENLAIFGALQLYLDFINIFLDLIRIFARNKD